jgi:hypothetical protein
LQPIYDEICTWPEYDCQSYHSDDYSSKYELLNNAYERVVKSLKISAQCTIPVLKSNALKFWWDQELDDLKDIAVSTAMAWKAAGKPKQGLMFDNYKQDKYKLAIRQKQSDNLDIYTNELNECLIKKDNTSFWKKWHAKFGKKYLPLR